MQEAIKSSLQENSSIADLQSHIEEIKTHIDRIRFDCRLIGVDVAPAAVLENYIKPQISLAFQMVGWEIYQEIRTQNKNIEETPFSKLVEFAIILCKNEQIPDITPLLIFFNLFEITPISECEKLWKVFASFQQDFSKPPFIKPAISNTQLHILVIVNSILRRASRMQYSSFRGDLMM